MKNMILTAAVALLISAAPAFAQHHDNDNAGHRAPHAAAHRATTTHRTVTHRTTVHRTGATNHRRAVTRTRTVKRHVSRNGTVHRNVTTHRNVRNVTALRANIRSPRRFHFTGVWHRPSGWYARRWGYGQRLPGGWFARNFWLTNYLSFGLTAPPDGYEWVREGNDAVLVDVDTGEIIRVEYDVFY